MDTKIKVPTTYWLYVLVVSILMFNVWYLWRENSHTMFPSLFYFSGWKVFLVILMPFIGIMYGVFFIFAWLQKAKKEQNGMPKDIVSKFMKSKFEVFYSHPEFFLKYNWYAWCVFLLLLSMFAIGNQIYRSPKIEVEEVLFYLILFIIITVPGALAPVIFFHVFKWLLEGKKRKDVIRGNDDPNDVESKKYHRLKIILKYGWYAWSLYFLLTFFYTLFSDKYSLDVVKIIVMVTALSLVIAVPFFLFQFLEWVGKKLFK